MLLALVVLTAAGAHAADTLPYTNRTLGYTGQSTTIRGDVKTLGLAGTTLGMPDTIQSTIDNPAGFAALGNGVAAELAVNTAKDSAIQTDSLGSIALGVGSNMYPWGFSVSYVAPRTEGQDYNISGVGDRKFTLGLEELRLSAGRVLWDRLSLGFGIGLLTASETLHTFSAQSSGFRFAGGLLLRLPSSLLFGASVQSGTNLAFLPWDPIAGFTGFFKEMQVPAKAGLGIAWIPNRFFRGGFSLDYIAPSSNIALLRSESSTIGGRPTFQPHLGVSYAAIDLRAIDVQISVGSYFEMSRTQGEPDRLHLTAGLEVKPWVLFFAWGMDLAYGYSSHVFAGGIDVLRLLSRLGALPREYRPPLGGVFPSISHSSDVGLPRFLVKDWEMDPRSQVRPQTIEAIGDHFRDSLGESLGNTGDELEDLGKGFVQDIKDVVKPRTKDVPKPKAKAVKNKVKVKKTKPTSRPKSQPRPDSPRKTSKPKQPS